MIKEFGFNVQYKDQNGTIGSFTLIMHGITHDQAMVKVVRSFKEIMPCGTLIGVN